MINPDKNPLVLFKDWFEEAKLKEINDPNAMNLVTIDINQQPSSRIVLLKIFDEQGFVFFTNLESKKGKDIMNNPNVALNFHWKSIRRQVRIQGKAIKISDSLADEYFQSRPQESKIGAWASKQSQELRDRQDLNDRILEFKKKFDNNVPRPPHWTGLRVEPTLIEFWQEVKFRLHDRVEYKKENNNWTSKKLYP